MRIHKVQEPTIHLPPRFEAGKIGIVTVTFGSGKVLPDFLASLDAQLYRNFMLVAVDNQSSDDSIAQLQAYGGCECTVIANESNGGVAAGNNQGIRAAIAADCEYVLLLNNDVIFGPELFQQLVEGTRKHRCQMTTPLIHYYDRPDTVWCAGGYCQRWLGYRCFHYGEGDKDRGQFNIPKAVTYAPTCCVLIRREVFERIGLMDERYFAYWDDSDFMLRALQAQQVLFYLPHAKLLHKVSSLTGGQSDFMRYYVYRNAAYYTRKHVGALLRWPILVMYRLALLLKVALRRDSRATYRLKVKAFQDGLKMTIASGAAE